MSKLRIKGVWNEEKGKLKRKHAKITDDDLTVPESKEEELYGRLHKRPVRTNEEIEEEVPIN